MFERLQKRAAAVAERWAETRRRTVAEQLGTIGMVAVEGDRVEIEGPGLARRLVVDPDLRWKLLEMRDE
jgi:hypothetical protein